MKLNDRPVPDLVLDLQPIARDVLLEKYAKGSESSTADIHRRVARALAEVEPASEREQYEGEFLAALQRGFIPAGRINSAGGTSMINEAYARMLAGDVKNRFVIDSASLG